MLDRVVNLLEEGIDAGVRIGELPDSSMKAVKVGRVRRLLCASPAYLAEYGTPQTPADLARHHIVAAVSVTPTVEWKFEHGGREHAVRLQPRLAVNNNDCAIEAAREGFGLTRLLSYQVAPLLESGALVTVLSDYDPAVVPIHIVHREGRYASAKLRTFVDLMVERLRAEKSLR
jgi:DNA-binding transcriptional LysR family regulator